MAANDIMIRQRNAANAAFEERQIADPGADAVLKFNNTTNLPELTPIATLFANAGAVTATSIATGTFTASGVSTFTNATNSTSVGTGAVVVTGGVGITGAVFAGSLTSLNNVTSGAAGGFYVNGRAFLSSPALGKALLNDGAGGQGAQLNFAISTSACPALRRVGTELQVAHAGNTAAANTAAVDAEMTFIEDRYRRKGAGTPEGAVTAPIGAVYHRTDGGAGTSVYFKESGTGNTGWVAK